MAKIEELNKYHSRIRDDPTYQPPLNLYWVIKLPDFRNPPLVVSLVELLSINFFAALFDFEPERDSLTLDFGEENQLIYDFLVLFSCSSTVRQPKEYLIEQCLTLNHLLDVPLATWRRLASSGKISINVDKSAPLDKTYREMSDSKRQFLIYLGFGDGYFPEKVIFHRFVVNSHGWGRKEINFSLSGPKAKEFSDLFPPSYLVKHEGEGIRALTKLEIPYSGRRFIVVDDQKLSQLQNLVDQAQRMEQSMRGPCTDRPQLYWTFRQSMGNRLEKLLMSDYQRDVEEEN